MRKQISQLVQHIEKCIQKNNFAGMVIGNYDFRTMVFSGISLIGGIGFIIINIVTFGISRSLWCGAQVVYHGVLASLRGYLLFNSYRAHERGVHYGRNQVLPEIKRYRFCGMAFIAITLCIMPLILFIVRGDKVFSYDIYVIYTIAGYTLFQISAAAVNYIKTWKNDNYTVRSLRCITLVSALVSFISVQAVSLDMFSSNVNIPIMNILTGFVVSALIVAMGVYMIVHANGKIKDLK